MGSCHSSHSATLNETTELRIQTQPSQPSHPDSTVQQYISHADVRDFYILDDRVLGQGQFGTVRKATHKTKGGRYAVKFIKKERVKRPEVLQREMEALLQVDHPHLCNVVDIFDSFPESPGKGILALVMDFYDGGELFDRIIERHTHVGSHEGFSEIEAAKIIHQVLMALDYLHDVVGICHRDLKPENILFKTKEKNSDIVLIDFGLSAFLNDDHAARMHDHMSTRVGTPYYMSPEVFSGNYDRSCDLWSLGIIAYCILCGYPPFTGANNDQILRNVRNPRNQVEFHQGEVWDHISNEAKCFIKTLVNRDANARPTARGGLEDEWFKRTECATMSLHDQIGPRLARFQQMKKLKKMTALVIATKMVEHLHDSTNTDRDGGVREIPNQLLDNESIQRVEQKRELSELIHIFRHINSSGDGVISLNELRLALEEHGEHHGDSTGTISLFSTLLSRLPLSNDRVDEQEWSLDVDELFNDLDLNGQHAINLTEFLAATLNRRWLIEPTLLRQAFDYFDTDNSGTITHENLVKLLQSEESVDFLTRELNLSRQEPITFDQFSDIMKAPSFKPLLSAPQDHYSMSREEIDETVLLAVANHWLDLRPDQRKKQVLTLPKQPRAGMGFRLSEVMDHSERLIVVRSVEEDSIGTLAGLKDWDILCEIDGVCTRSLDLLSIKEALVRNQTCTLTVGKIDQAFLKKFLNETQAASVQPRILFSIEAKC